MSSGGCGRYHVTIQNRDSLEGFFLLSRRSDLMVELSRFLTLDHRMAIMTTRNSQKLHNAFDI
jgi:hypothetical protein